MNYYADINLFLQDFEFFRPSIRSKSRTVVPRNFYRLGLQRQKQLKKQKQTPVIKKQNKPQVQIIKKGSSRIINLRPVIKKKVGEEATKKTTELLTQMISLTTEPPKPKVINLRPLIEKKVNQEMTKNALLMGVPLGLFLLV